MTSRNRPLFKRPAWAKASANEDEDIFRRSNRIYKVVEQVSLKDGTRDEDCPKRTSSSTLPEPDLPRDTDDRDEKRLSTGLSATPSQDEHSRLVSSTKQGVNDTSNTLLADPPSLLQGYSVAVKQGAHGRKRKLDYDNTEIVDLEVFSEHSSRAGSDLSLHVETTKTNQNLTQNENRSEDDEFPELARLARERARRRRLERAPFQGLLTVVEAGFPEIYSKSSSISLPSEDDPTVQILVTSNIPDTEPLIVTRRLSQRLKDVKTAWVQHQRTPLVQLDHTFLTWRGKRVFDVVSCKGLGIKAETVGGAADGHQDGCVHMVAMTKESYDLIRQARDKKHSADEYPDETISSQMKAVLQDEPQIRIILQSRSFTDFKLIVKPVGCSSS